MHTDRPLTYIIGQTMNLVKMRMNINLKERGIEISPELFVIMYLINNKEDITQQDLANHFQKDKSSILRQINTLIDLRYVARMPDKQDKRKKNLVLTKLGYDILELTREVSREVSTELLEGITPEELETFEAVIKKIQVNTKQTNLLSSC